MTATVTHIPIPVKREPKASKSQSADVIKFPMRPTSRSAKDQDKLVDFYNESRNLFPNHSEEAHWDIAVLSLNITVALERVRARKSDQANAAAVT